MKKMIIISAMLLTISLIGCAPDQFILNQKGNIIGGLIMSDLNSVENKWENAFLLHEGGRVALRSSFITQLIGDFTITLLEGEGVRFAFRTVSNNYKDHPSITLDLTIDGAVVKENGREISRSDDSKTLKNKQHRVIIQNDGDVVRILVDCDEVYKGTTILEATEYIIVESIRASEIYVSGINFADILQTDDLFFENREEILTPVDIGK